MNQFKFNRNQKVKLNLCGKQYIGHIYSLDKRWDNADQKMVNVYHFTTLTYDHLHAGMGVRDHLKGDAGIDWNFEESLFEEING